jgi:maltose/moltooligosaccharide transporter
MILVSFGILALTDKMDNGIPVSTYWAFTIGAVASITTILITVFTTSEYPPTQKELEQINNRKSKGNQIVDVINDITSAIIKMPKPMIQLIPVMFFPWFAMFCYWQFFTSALSLSLFETLDQESVFFNQAQLLTGNINGTYNIVCFLSAFALVPIARKFGAKNLHFFSLVIGGLGLLIMPYLSNTVVVLSFGGFEIEQIYIFAILMGITWASIISMPYQILAESIPINKMGVYMGIFNMFIVIAQIVQIFTVQFFIYDLLGENPINIIRLAGVFMIIGGFSSLYVKSQNS